MTTRKLICKYIRWRIKNKETQFSKKLCYFTIAIMVLTIIVSTILAILDKNPITDVTVAIITTCGGYLCTYGIKSAFEKNSRNKYGISESGIPYSQEQEQGEYTYG